MTEYFFCDAKKFNGIVRLTEQTNLSNAMKSAFYLNNLRCGPNVENNNAKK